MNNEIKINVPEGMEIDKENSTFECIKFKPKWVPKRGDIAAAGSDHKQIVLVDRCIEQSNIIGFGVQCLAVLDMSEERLILLRNNNFWVSEEAFTSEKELFINKLKENGYIYDPNDPRVIYKKEKELPKTWEEFCDNNPIKPNEVFITNESDIVDANFHSNKRESVVDAHLLPSREYAEAMLALCKLIQLRDCYNDGWKPDWNNSETKYAIHARNNKLEVSTVGTVSFVLTFKTDELRHTFLDNFKDLIEQAKLLL